MPTIPAYWLVDWAIITAARLLAALLTTIVAVECSVFFSRRR
jgi:hypothetical protein